MEEILNVKSALAMLGGETDLLKELLMAFLKDRPLEKETLLSLAAQEDKMEAAKYVHYYKGSGRQIGAEKLGSTGQALETFFRNGGEGNAEPLIHDFLEAYYEATVEASQVLTEL